MITDSYRWRRWESKTDDSGSFDASAGNHARAGLEPEVETGKQKSSGENALPTGKTADGGATGRADVGTVPTASTLGELARAVISKSRHKESRMLAEAVLELLRRSSSGLVDDDGD